MNTEIQSWLLPVEPFEGESLSHFLGRFRRQNHLSPSALGDLAGVGAVIARWERFHLNPFPSDCYQEEPYHRLKWQYQSTGGCVRDSVALANPHRLRLLSKCRNCQADFPIPALWEDGCCTRCRLSFGKMVKWQKSY